MDFIKDYFKIGISRLSLLYALLAVIIGLLVGAVDALFGRVLILITDFRDAHVVYLLPFLALVGLLIVLLYQKLGGEAGKGMSLIFEAGNKGREKIPKRLVPLGMLATWLSHLFGASVGREGFAVQIGGVIGHFFGGLLSNKAARRILLMTGMAAGFGGLFQTPIAATFFAIEILMLGKIEFDALFPALVAAYVASYTSAFLGLEKFSYQVTSHLEITPVLIGKLLLIAICFGLVGRLFAMLLKFAKARFASLIKNPYLRIFSLGLFVSLGLLALHFGRYAGLGTNLVSASFNGDVIYGYDWILKLLFTVLSLAAGFQGGEVTPIFTIGATLGASLAALFGLPVPLIAAAGYASVFAAATNSYFAPIFIAGEVFGFGSLVYIVPIITVAYVMNGNVSMYPQEKLDL